MMTGRLLDGIAARVELRPALRRVGTTADRDWPVSVLHDARPDGEHLCTDRYCSRCVILRLEWRLQRPRLTAR